MLPFSSFILNPGPHGPSATFIPTEDFPALQYLENVDKNSPADKAGLKKGDFILEVIISIPFNHWSERFFHFCQMKCIKNTRQIDACFDKKSSIQDVVDTIQMSTFVLAIRDGCGRGECTFFLTP